MPAPFQPPAAVRKQASGLRASVNGAAWLLVVFGLAASAAWIARAAWLGQFLPGLFRMKLNTSVSFFAAGVALLAAIRNARRVSTLAAGLILSLGAATLVEYLTGASLGIDQFWVADFDQPGIPYPGRMAPNTSLAFLLAGVAILLATYPRLRKAWRDPAVGLLGFLVFAFGAVGLAGHVQHVADAYSWGSYTQMAVFTSVGFIALGLCLIALAWEPERAHPARIPLWVPVALSLLVIIVDIGTPLGVAVGIVYVPLIFCSLWFSSPRASFVFASGATLLTAIAFLAKPYNGVPLWMVVADRSLTIGALWVTAVLVYWQRTTQEALRDSERRYQLVTHGMSIGVWDWDLLSNRQYWSPRMRELVGVTDQDFVPVFSDPDPFVHPEDREKVTASLQAHIAERRPYDIEFRIRRKDGGVSWVHSMGQALWDESGVPLRMVGSLDDITGRKRAEARLHAVVDYAVDGLITIDESGRIQNFNPACERIFGYFSAEVVGQNIRMLMPEPYHSEHDNYLSHYIASGEAHIIGTSGREVSGKRKDGSVFRMDLSVCAFQLEDGRYFSGIIRDITEQKQTELALAETNNRFRLLVEGVKAHALFTIDTGGCITSWNRGAERLLGYTESEIVGHDFSCMFTSEDIQRGVPETQMNKARDSGLAEDEGWRVRANGDRFWAYVNKTALLDEECSIRGFAVVVHDITERKKIALAMEEARLEKLRLQEGFLSHVSHELRTPLTAIYFFTTNVLDGIFGDLTDAQREQLMFTLDNANQLKSMVSDLLDVTRVETHKLTVTHQPTNLSRLVAEVLSTCQTNAAAGKITVSSQFPTEPPFAWADSARVRQILTKLIDNAIKFTPQDGTVTVGSRPYPEDEGFLCLSVADTGCGIGPESREAIFERLTQVKNSSEPSRSGLGLGLFICRELVTLHGGRIWVESILGEGSTFYFTLPVFSVARWCNRVLIAPTLETGSVTLITVDITIFDGPHRANYLHEIRRALERCIHPAQDVVLPATGNPHEGDGGPETIFIVACTGAGGFSVIEGRIQRELQTSINIFSVKPIVSSTTVPITAGLPREAQIEEITAGIERLVQEHLAGKEKVS